jgi:hypothetical protein
VSSYSVRSFIAKCFRHAWSLTAVRALEVRVEFPACRVREPEVEPNRLLNDLGQESVTRIADFLHPLGYRAASGTARATLHDNAWWVVGRENSERGELTGLAFTTVRSCLR